MTEKDEVVSVYKSNPRKYTLQTTRSWEFSGLNKLPNSDNHLINSTDDDDDVLLKSRYGKNVIIGIVDSGISLSRSLALFLHFLIYIYI